MFFFFHSVRCPGTPTVVSAHGPNHTRDHKLISVNAFKRFPLFPPPPCPRRSFRNLHDVHQKSFVWYARSGIFFFFCKTCFLFRQVRFSNDIGLILNIGNTQITIFRRNVQLLRASHCIFTFVK